jgi:uncharacterized protein YbaR (Trm112 family)
MVTVPLEGGLVNDDRSLLYPDRNEIACLLKDEAIPLHASSEGNP